MLVPPGLGGRDSPANSRDRATPALGPYSEPFGFAQRKLHEDADSAWDERSSGIWFSGLVRADSTIFCCRFSDERPIISL